MTLLLKEPHMPFRKISNPVASYSDEMINLQIKLASLPAIAPASRGEGEVKKAKFLVKFLRENAFQDIEVIKAPDLDTPSGYR